MKIDKYDFERKRKIIISINNDIIDDKMNVQNIHLFDKIFNDISLEESWQNELLFQMWIDVRTSTNMYYKKNKKLLDRKLKSINDLLKSEQVSKKETKVKKEEKPVVKKNRFQTSRFAYMFLMVLSVIGFLECYTIYSTWKAEGAKTDALMTDLLASTEITEQEVDI